MAGQVRPLSAGDVFFTFPGIPFCIESRENFSYMYISFLGSRALMIMDKLKISSASCYFPSCSSIAPFWAEAFHVHEELADIMAESVLLYTFSYIGSLSPLSEKRLSKLQTTFLVIKKYIDDNFSDPALSLFSISEALSYNPNYISGVFKKQIGIGFAHYLSAIRIQNARTLMEQGMTSIKEIAKLSGFRDPLYFSKTFKREMNQSPKDYCLSLRRS